MNYFIIPAVLLALAGFFAAIFELHSIKMSKNVEIDKIRQTLEELMSKTVEFDKIRQNERRENEFLEGLQNIYNYSVDYTREKSEVTENE